MDLGKFYDDNREKVEAHFETGKYIIEFLYSMEANMDCISQDRYYASSHSGIVHMIIRDIYNSYAEILNLISSSGCYVTEHCGNITSLVPLNYFILNYYEYKSVASWRIPEILERFKFFKSLDLSNVDALKAVEAHFKTSTVDTEELPVL